MLDNWQVLKEEFDANGYLLIKKFFDPTIINNLSLSIGEADFQALGCDTYFEVINGTKTLRRVERSYDKFDPLTRMMNQQHYLDFLEKIQGEPVCLFKDKINFKSSGGAGFDLHVDGHFYWQTEESGPEKKGWLHYGNSFLNAVIPLQSAHSKNGALRIARSEVTRQRLGNSWLEITNSLSEKGPFLTASDCDEIETETIEMEVGDLLLFDWTCIHGSEKNTSISDRPILYLTYNGASDGPNKERYYQEKHASIADQSNKNLSR